MDAQDVTIIRTLQKSGRVSYAEIGHRIGLSTPAVTERIRKLEQQGFISGYAALVNAYKLGKSLTAFISVEIRDPDVYEGFEGAIVSLEEVLECHHVVGEFDYLLKVKTRDTSSLEDLISRRIRTIEGVGRTRTTVVLSSIKESPQIDLGSVVTTTRSRKSGQT